MSKNEKYCWDLLFKDPSKIPNFFISEDLQFTKRTLVSRSSTRSLPDLCSKGFCLRSENGEHTVKDFT